MTKTKFTPEQKIQIVLESFRTNIGTAELCRKHNIHPTTFQTWEQLFIDAGKARLSQHGKTDPLKASKRETDNLKRTVEELMIVNDILKKVLEEDIGHGHTGTTTED